MQNNNFAKLVSIKPYEEYLLGIQNGSKQSVTVTRHYNIDSICINCGYITKVDKCKYCNHYICESCYNKSYDNMCRSCKKDFFSRKE